MQTAVKQYVYRVNQMQQNPIDACTDAAEFWGIPVAQLAEHLVGLGINADKLQRLVDVTL